MGWDWGGCEPLAFIPPGVTPPLPSQVGFLKILHKYEIAFLLPPSQRLGKDVCALPLPNPNLRVLSVTSGPEGKVPVSSAPPPSGSWGWLLPPWGAPSWEPEVI